jgi:D-xylose transport system substrate-binding protein
LKGKCLSVAILLFFLAGCSKASPSLAEKPLTIGFCIDSLVLERWQKDLDAFTAEAEKLGAKVEARNANGDLELQVNQANELINNDSISAIVILPIDGSKFSEIIAKAKSRDKIVIAYDRLILNSAIDAFISFDTENIAPYMMRELEKVAPKGNYLLIGGSLLDNNMKLIAEGIHRELEENENIQLLDEVYCDNWSSISAYRQLSAILGENRDAKIDAVVCGNDSLAVGAIRALSEYRLAGRVAVSGQDADLESCQRIIEGTQTMTIYKPVDLLGKKAAQVAVGLAQGFAPEGGQRWTENGYDILRCTIPIEVVTKLNMRDVIIESGFHREEEVYMTGDG